MATADRETTDREPEAPRGPALPSARLNPLLNPLLAKQLGRWAHIYYTASVDKREAAIEKLVCELEAEEATMAEAGSAAAPAPHEAIEQNSVAPRMPGPVLVASPRSEPLPAEPPIVESETAEQEVSANAPQDVLALPVAVASATNSPGEFENRVEPLPVEAGIVASTAAASVPESWQALLRQHATEPDSLPAYVPKIDLKSAEDYRSFGDLLAKSDAAIADAAKTSPPPQRRWRAASVAVAVLAVLGGSLWVGQRWVAQNWTAQSTQSRSATTNQARVPQRQPDPPAVATKPLVPPSPTPAFAPATVTPPWTDAVDQAGARHALLSKDTPPAESTPPADPELAAGMRSLQGNGVPRDSAEAARHLWQSVKKQNGSALVILAGLYAQGDGVARDCDQAKILLVAATKQAKSHTQFQHVEAARETLRTSGCEW